jgi:hypothetical protein
MFYDNVMHSLTAPVLDFLHSTTASLAASCPVFTLLGHPKLHCVCLQRAQLARPFLLCDDWGASSPEKRVGS